MSNVFSLPMKFGNIESVADQAISCNKIFMGWSHDDELYRLYSRYLSFDANSKERDNIEKEIKHLFEEKKYNGSGSIGHAVGSIKSFLNLQVGDIVYTYNSEQGNDAFVTKVIDNQIGRQELRLGEKEEKAMYKNVLPFKRVNHDDIVKLLKPYGFTNNLQGTIKRFVDSDKDATKMKIYYDILNQAIAEGEIALSVNNNPEEMFDTYTDVYSNKVSSIPNRNPIPDKMKQVIRKRANNSCERKGCNTPQPFLKKNNEVFLEFHHIIEASKKESNHSVGNIALLCANCHREIHYGKHGESIKAQLVKDIR